MKEKAEKDFQREGLETARCPTGVGSNPTPPVITCTHPHLEEFEKFLQGRVRKATARGYRKIVHVLRKLGNSDDPQKMRR